MRVALMATCIGDTMFPDVAKATVRLLERLGVEVDVPPAQTCCGQPMINTGYFDEAEPVVRSYASTFADYDAVVLPSGSCAGSVRHQHEIIARRSGDAGLVAAVERHGPRAHELSQFLVDVLGVTDVIGKARVIVLPVGRWGGVPDTDPQAREGQTSAPQQGSL